MTIKMDAENALIELLRIAAERNDQQLSAALRQAIERIETLKAMLAHAEMVGDELARMDLDLDKAVARKDSFREVATLQAIPDGQTRHDGPFMLAHHWLRLKTLEPGTKLFICSDG